ncbi:MAG: hypothetical protein LH466_02005 [Sphingomonas bacterium]|nr:hypothetical protein [Sphingomonas bacterium]
MGVRGEDVLVGVACALLALLLLRRIVLGLRDGTMPVYRTQLSRAEAGPGRYAALIAANALVMVLLVVIAADLLLGLGLRGR